MADVFQSVSRACCALYTLQGRTESTEEEISGFLDHYKYIIEYVRGGGGRRELVRPCVRLIGSLVDMFPSLAGDAQGVLMDVVGRYVRHEGDVTFEDCVEALYGIRGGVSQDGVMGDFVIMLLGVEDAADRRKGCLAALRACPGLFLKKLCDLVNSEGGTKDKAAECVMTSVMDDSICLVSEYEPDLVLHGSVMNSVLESSIDKTGDEKILAECQRYMQALMVNTSIKDTDSVDRVMDRLTKKVFQKITRDGDGMADKEAVLEDMEEGELLDSVPATTATAIGGVDHGSIEGIVPKKIVHGIEIYGMPESARTSGIRDDCDKFTGVKNVEQLQDGVLVMCTSMPGTVRCYEAMCTRGESFWSIDGLEEAPRVELASYRKAVEAGVEVKHVHIVLPGVEHVEQEDTIKERLQEANIEIPSSFTPVNVGEKGLILSFENADSVEKAFACLGGEEEKDTLKRSRDDNGDLDDTGREKRERRDSAGSWTGQIVRNKQLQCSVVARVADGSMSAIPYGTREPEEWPQALEVNQRADVKYLCDTLFPSTDTRYKHLAILQPLEEGDERGLKGFNQYLIQKQRAGVVFLPPSSSASQRTLYLIPVTDDVCYRLQVDRHKVRWPSMIGIVVYRP